MITGVGQGSLPFSELDAEHYDGTVENVFGPTGLAEQVTGSSQTAQFASADALGSIRLITDGSGNVVGTGSYSPWGVPGSGSLTLDGFGFAGEQVDAETGFVYLRRRYYDPITSQFLTQDSPGLPGSGVNLYAYAHDNPVVRVDPSGQQDIFDEGLGEYGLGGGGLGGGEVVSPGGGGSVEPPIEEPALQEPATGPSSSGVETTPKCPLDRGAGAGGDTTTLYRAVGQNELADIQNTGQYRPHPEGRSAEGKYFFPTQQQMEQFAQAGNKGYWGTSVQVSPSDLAKAYYYPGYWEGDTYYFSPPDIPPGPITIMGQIY